MSHVKFGDNRNCNNGGMLLISYVTSSDRTFKVSCTLYVEGLHGESPPYHIWWPLVQSKWTQKILNLSRDLPKSRD